MIDPISILPMHVSSDGKTKAWRVDLEKARAARGLDPKDDGTLDMWLIEAPWAHPNWHSYVLILVHLRPMPDNRPTAIYEEGATHEIWLYALDPTQPRLPLLERAEFYPLHPINFAAQLVGETDANARDRIERAAKLICRGVLSPDTDFRHQWVKLFGGNMLRGTMQ